MQGDAPPRDAAAPPGMMGAHQADADSAILIGWAENIALGPGQPLVQAACKAGGSGGAIRTAGIGGGPGLTCAAGAAAPGRGGQRVGAGDGAAHGFAQNSPPLRRARTGSAPRRTGAVRGTWGGSPGRCSSGTPVLSSERRAPAEPPGASSEGTMGWRYRGVPPPAGWPGRRGAFGSQELQQGSGVKGTPWGQGGDPPSREEAGGGWADAAGTAGWATGPGWIWGNLEGKEQTSPRAGGDSGRPCPQGDPGTFAGDPVAAEAVAGAAGAEEAARGVVAGVLAGSALARPPAFVDISGGTHGGLSVAGQEVPPPREAAASHPLQDEDKVTAPTGWAQPSPLSPGFHGTKGDKGGRVLTHAGVPVPVEVVAGPAGAAVAADAVLAAVLARRGQALVCI